MPNEPLRILAVDDVPENLVALEAAIDQPGVEIVSTGSGMEALELLLREDFALALLDVQMPGMDGFELAELMRGTERTRAVPIIFLTAVATDERRRFRGFEAGAVDYLLKPLDVSVLNSKVAVFVELARQRREIAAQRDQLGLALSRLHAHGDNSPLAVFEIDHALRIATWFKGAERITGFAAGDMLGLKLEDTPLLHGEDRAGVIAALRALIGEDPAGSVDTSGRRAVQDHRFCRADGTRREGEWYLSALPSGRHRGGSVMIELLDVTERRQAERTQRLLIGELNHRVKNSLATVQAIASQGFRHARSPEDFQAAFTGRLQALARAHSLLSATTWESASLRQLISDQVETGTLGEERLRLEGPDVDLPPEIALRFALILHELATNANKYGALSNETGTVTLAWTRRGDWVSLVWTERGGPPVPPPTRRGFGSSLIEHSLSADGATITIDYRPEGVCCRLEVPLVPDARREEEPPQPETEQPDPAQTTASEEAQEPTPLPLPVAGLRVLVVEDEPLVAMELVMEIEDNGGEAVGPASSCKQAIALIREECPDVALLDGNLNGERIDSVADELAARATPFAFVSGYDREHLPKGHGTRPMLAKPFLGAEVCAMVVQLGEEARRQPATGRAA